MNERKTEKLAFYEELPQSFRAFAAEVFAVYRGYERQESRAHAEALLKGRHREAPDEIRQDIERFLDRAEECYDDSSVSFAIMLYHLSHELCLSKALCLEAARWLQRQNRVTADNFKETMKALSYLCGTNDENALKQLSSSTFEEMQEVFAHTIDYLDDDLLTPWVPDHIKEADRMKESMDNEAGEQ